VCIEFATSSRRLPTKIWKLNMLRIYPVELSRVELCRRCVHTRRLSWPSLQFCSVYMTGAENWKLSHDWRLVRSHRRQNATRLRCRQIVQTRRDCRQLVVNSIHTADATQLDSWVASAVRIGLNSDDIGRRLCGGYDNIGTGGHTCNALVDFTGGISESIDLRKMRSSPGDFFDIMYAMMQKSSMMACDIEVRVH